MFSLITPGFYRGCATIIGLIYCWQGVNSIFIRIETTILEQFDYLVKLKMHLLYDPEIPFLGICANTILTYVHQETHTTML